MRLALQTDYALRTLLYVSTRAKRVTVHEVAAFYRISEHHIGKVVHRLGQLGYVRNIRGPGGGVELARPVAEITVGGVIRQFEGVHVHALDCLVTDGVCVIQPGCTLRGVLREGERRQFEYLDSVSLQELLPAKRDLSVFLA